jgi:hypothetical protein
MGVISFSDKQLSERQAVGAADQPLNSAAPSVPSLRMQISLSTVAGRASQLRDGESVEQQRDSPV